MAEFDAELYLRLAGEQMVLDRRGEPGRAWDSALDAAAHALVAVGVLPAATAQAIVDDYYLALSSRSGEEPHFRQHRRMMAQQAAAVPAGAVPAGAAPGRPGRSRAVNCGQLIEQPWGQLLVDYVVLGADMTVLHVTMRPPPSAPGGRFSPAALRRRLRPPGAGGHMTGAGVPGQLTVTDDQGTSVSAGFSGGGSDTEWTGEFEARPGLAPDTAWIEVLGQRIELVDEPGPGIEVWVEPVAEQHLGRRYLQARLAMLLRAYEDAPLEATIDTLVAAGTLAASDPAIAEARAVVARQSHRGPVGSGAGGPGQPGRLAEPWRSLLAGGGRGHGPGGRVMVGVATPPFQGMSLALLAVHSGAEEFTADVELSPGLPHWHTGLTQVDEPMLVWWAADDRGGHYLGQPARWHSEPGRAGGQVEFWPALDPAATRLDIIPTTLTQRAVIRIPLPWAAAR